MNQENDKDSMSDESDNVINFEELHADELEIDRVSKLIENLQNENDSLKDRMMRLMADMENLRRRTQKDINDAKSYSMASFARDMLAVSDNLRRAIDAVPEDSVDAGLTPMIEGVSMTERELLNVFEKHGIQKIDPVGQKFDPNFHQAMFEIPNPDVTNGTVLNVVAAGYVIGDRVLRPAMVGVSKGGPKASPNNKTDNVNDSQDVFPSEDSGTEPGSNIDKSS